MLDEMPMEFEKSQLELEWVLERTLFCQLTKITGRLLLTEPSSLIGWQAPAKNNNKPKRIIEYNNRKCYELVYVTE